MKKYSGHVVKQLFGLVLPLLALLAVLAPPPVALAAELVMFERQHCPFCIRWKRDIGVFYHKTDEGKRAPLRIVDMDKTRPDDLRHIKGLWVSPTFVLLDDAGREVGRLEGYQNEDSFWFLLGELLARMDKRKDNRKDNRQ